MMLPLPRLRWLAPAGLTALVLAFAVGRGHAEGTADTGQPSRRSGHEHALVAPRPLAAPSGLRLAAVRPAPLRVQQRSAPPGVAAASAAAPAIQSPAATPGVGADSSARIASATGTTPVSPAPSSPVASAPRPAATPAPASSTPSGGAPKPLPAPTTSAPPPIPAPTNP